MPITETTCPVCNLEHISRYKDRCPQCDSDLVCFKILDNLQEIKVPESKESNRAIIDNQNFKSRKSDIINIMGDSVTANDFKVANKEKSNKDKVSKKFAIIEDFAVIEDKNSDIIDLDTGNVENKIQQKIETLPVPVIISPVSYKRRHFKLLYPVFVIILLFFGVIILNNDISDQSKILQFKIEHHRKNSTENNIKDNTLVDVIKEKSNITSNTDVTVNKKFNDSEGIITNKEINKEINKDINIDQKIITNAGIKVKKSKLSTNVNIKVNKDLKVATDTNDIKYDKSLNLENIKVPVKLSKNRLCFKVYSATNTDTLWGVAEKFYGSGLLFPVLLEHNPKLFIYAIYSRDKIKYLCDKSKAVAIYKKIIRQGKNKVYWTYKVRKGDTTKSLIKKYCPVDGNCIESDLVLKTGDKIIIILK